MSVNFKTMVQQIEEKLRIATSFLIVMETDLEATKSDTVYLDVVKEVHKLIVEAQQNLLQATDEIG